MIRSMTAFADGEITADNMIIYCEIRSVNHRYSDISIKIPERLRFAELEVRRLISQKIKRGKIDCSLSYKKQSGAMDFAINLDLVEKLLSVTEEIEAKMRNPQAYSALDVLAFPGVQQETETSKDLLLEKITTLLESTLDSLLSTRNREGAQLTTLLTERCEKVSELVATGRKRMPEVLENLRNKLTSRIVELVADPNFDRLEQELVLLAQKLDVSEELDRLETHVAEVLHTFKQTEPSGRRLDFLMQEMNREANTLGSKSADKEMTQVSISLKVLIEQMREQIQNIE